jgi:hypothetical protein
MNTRFLCLALLLVWTTLFLIQSGLFDETMAKDILGSSWAESNIAFFINNLPNVRLVSFEDGVHDLELHKPRETATLIHEFIEKNAFQDAPNLAIKQTAPTPEI